MKDCNMLDDTGMEFLDELRENSKKRNGGILYSPFLFRVVRDVFPCDLIAVPHRHKMDAAMVIVAQVPGSRKDTTVEVIKCVCPGEEKTKTSLSGLLNLMNSYGCNHGVVMNFERALIFNKRKRGKREKKDSLEEIKAIELTRTGYEELAHYWCTLKPQCLLDFEQRRDTRNFIREDFKSYLKYDNIRDADKEPAPPNARQTNGVKSRNSTSGIRKRRAAALGRAGVVFKMKEQ